MTPPSATQSPQKQGIRRSGARAARRARRQGQASRLICRELSHPLFPITYFTRNLRTLSREPGWIRLAPRIQRQRWLEMLAERCAFFKEIRNWTAMQAAWTWDPPGESPEQECDSPHAASHYCIHCGGCCEIASGLPEFPSPNPIPGTWRAIFGNGLGRGHRFCPFLWEAEGSGLSLCSIHPWRSLACRTFEREECEVLLNDPDYTAFSRPGEIQRGFRSLLRVIAGSPALSRLRQRRIPEAESRSPGTKHLFLKGHMARTV